MIDTAPAFVAATTASIIPLLPPANLADAWNKPSGLQNTHTHLLLNDIHCTRPSFISSPMHGPNAKSAGHKNESKKKSMT